MESMGDWLRAHPGVIEAGVLVLAAELYRRFKGPENPIETIHAPRRMPERAAVHLEAKHSVDSRLESRPPRAPHRPQAKVGLNRPSDASHTSAPWRLMGRLNRFTLDPHTPPAARAVARGLGVGLVCATTGVVIIPTVILKGRFLGCFWSPSTTCDYLQLSVALPLGGAITGTVLAATTPLTRRTWLSIPTCIVACIPLVAALAISDITARSHWQLTDSLWVAGLSALIGTLVGLPDWKRS